MLLTRETFTGSWAGLPVAWTDDDRFDEATYRGNVARCCKAGMPGVYSGGTTGEFYAMEFDEFQEVVRATVEECRAHQTPAMVGCTSTYTRGAVRRAEYAAEVGADAVQVAMPFWMEIGEEQIVPFFSAVSAACGHIPLSIYETTRTKRVLTVRQHRAIKEAVPNYLMVKAQPGTVGTTVEGCHALSEFINVFVGENLWLELGPVGAIGCCSSMVYWNPRIFLAYWSHFMQKDWQSMRSTHEKIAALHEFLHDEFGPRGYVDSAYDRLGGIAGGFLKNSLKNSRPPYPSATTRDVEILREWYRKEFAEMLEL